MKQHTMQEWADWTGCYVTKNETDDQISIHDDIPEKKSVLILSDFPDPYYDPTYWYSRNQLYITKFVSDAQTHDWTVLVEPQKKE